MAMQTFRCPIHGEFDIKVALGEDVPKSFSCTADVPGPEPVDPLDAKSPPATLRCGESSKWVPPKVTAIFNWAR